MDRLAFTITGKTLDQVRPRLEQAARDVGVVLDFLMRRWNGRFATYNVGRPAPGQGRRPYRLVGRIKLNTHPNGTLYAVLSPPAACDPRPAPEDEEAFEAFWRALQTYLDGHIRLQADDGEGAEGTDV